MVLGAGSPCIPLMFTDVGLLSPPSFVNEITPSALTDGVKGRALRELKG